MRDVVGFHRLKSSGRACCNGTSRATQFIVPGKLELMIYYVAAGGWNQGSGQGMIRRKSSSVHIELWRDNLCRGQGGKDLLWRCLLVDGADDWVQARGRKPARSPEVSRAVADRYWGPAGVCFTPSPLQCIIYLLIPHGQLHSLARYRVALVCPTSAWSSAWHPAKNPVVRLPGFRPYRQDGQDVDEDNLNGLPGAHFAARQQPRSFVGRVIITSTIKGGPCKY
ncbi:hypothetical protein K456DRAFT_37332 [Colletotrichum gloeosporioides 23]|nr:hypothetical protein K456DRAFT_37332 [Colletotrichum gloeosporioides 23]